MESFKVQLLH